MHSLQHCSNVYGVTDSSNKGLFADFFSQLMFRCLIDLEHTSKLRDGENYILHASLHNVLTPIQMVVTAFVYFTKLQLELISF